MVKNKSCAICGNPNIRILKSSINSILSGQYYCSNKCFLKGQRFYFLFFFIIWSIGSLAILSAILYNFAKGYKAVIGELAYLVSITFGIELILMIITIYSFKVKIIYYSRMEPML